jgi:hypothetical protein
MNTTKALSRSRTAIIITLLFFIAACSNPYQNNQDLVGKKFPSLEGQTLEKLDVSLPEYFDNRPVLLLIGYVQDSQFDIDRWLIGLDMTQTDIEVYELPAIRGIFPRMFKSQINNGMRRGIPKALWKGVITVYKDGDLMQKMTGNTLPNNARCVLLDGKGIIRYFYDQGFSVATLTELRQKIKTI